MHIIHAVYAHKYSTRCMKYPLIFILFFIHFIFSVLTEDFSLVSATVKWKWSACDSDQFKVWPLIIPRSQALSPMLPQWSHTEARIILELMLGELKAECVGEVRVREVRGSGFQVASLTRWKCGNRCRQIRYLYFYSVDYLVTYFLLLQCMLRLKHSGII